MEKSSEPADSVHWRPGSRGELRRCGVLFQCKGRFLHGTAARHRSSYMDSSKREERETWMKEKICLIYNEGICSSVLSWAFLGRQANPWRADRRCECAAMVTSGHLLLTFKFGFSSLGRNIRLTDVQTGLQPLIGGLHAYLELMESGFY